jgi:hypothetical protein
VNLFSQLALTNLIVLAHIRDYLFDVIKAVYTVSPETYIASLRPRWLTVLNRQGSSGMHCEVRIEELGQG